MNNKTCPSIYIASKTKHACKWRQLRNCGLNIISTWIDEAGQGETNNWQDLWRRCVNESSNADILVVYIEPGEILKGALVEVGAALSHNVPIRIIGDPTGQGSWWKAEGVSIVNDWNTIIDEYKQMHDNNTNQ